MLNPHIDPKAHEESLLLFKVSIKSVPVLPPGKGASQERNGVVIKM